MTDQESPQPQRWSRDDDRALAQYRNDWIDETIAYHERRREEREAPAPTRERVRVELSDIALNGGPRHKATRHKH